MVKHSNIIASPATARGHSAHPIAASDGLRGPKWAVNARSLYIDLPAVAFADAGALQVWFLRDDAVIWRETIAWPGIGAQRDAARTPAAKPAE